MATQKYKVTSPIKRGGKIISPGQTISLTSEEAKGLHVTPLAKQSEPEETTEPGKEGGESASKKALMAINKSETIELVKAAGYPESEWGELNKEPLVDYYLEKQLLELDDEEAES